MGSVLHSLRHVPAPEVAPAQNPSKCHGKVKRTRLDAERHAAYLMSAPGAKPVEPYPCNECHGWHVGSPMVKGPPRKIKPFRKRR